MASVPYSNDQFAEEAAAFAEKITPARARWEYCFNRSTYEHEKYGLCVNMRTVPVVARILGIYHGRVKTNFFLLRNSDFENARARANARPSRLVPERFAVGPMQAWHVGHLYFARVKSHPHVVKIGFSRRVRDRVDDIESKVKAALFVEKGQMRVGTHADEHWWHKNWDDHRISGEWFFDPFTTGRSLPAFLAEPAKQEAA
jgi:hypothetical protein